MGRENEMNDVRSTYWAQGTALILDCQGKAQKADPADAPIGLTPEQAALWHRAQAEAYRHALEMMAPPVASDAVVAATNESVARMIAEKSDPRGRFASGKLLGFAEDGREIRAHTSQGGTYDDILGKTGADKADR